MKNVNTTLTQNRNYVKIATAIIIAMLFVLSWVIIYYAEQIKIAKAETAVLQHQADSLASLIKLNEELEAQRITSNNIATENNDLAKANDSLVASLNEVLKSSKLLATNYSTAVEVNSAEAPASAQIKRQVTFALKKIEEIDKRTTTKVEQQEQYTIYIQYMPDHAREAEKVAVLLSKETDYKVPPMERIEKTTFDNGVRYFDDKDAAAANKIKTNLWKAGIKCRLQKINMRTAKHHIEIWLGEKDKAKEATLILDKLNRKTRN